MSLPIKRYFLYPHFGQTPFVQGDSTQWTSNDDFTGVVFFASGINSTGEGKLCKARFKRLGFSSCWWLRHF